MLELCSIASGSSGNCICVGSDGHHVLIDAGISGKRIEEGLNSIDLKSQEMEGILITHEHIDHIAGLGVMARRYGLPMYATAGTIEAIGRVASVGKIDGSLFHVVRPGETFTIGDLEFTPISISHDAADPVAYRFSCGKRNFAVVTDLGTYDEALVSKLQGLDALLLESNHDIHMLETGIYPYPLKQRILGDRGHLSNERSGELLCRLLHDAFGAVMLGHLSKENNYEELAYEAVRMEITMGDNPYKAEDFPIYVAKRDRPSTVLRAL
ncbi:MAG: MBL fold metallo-hydrolase [Muribaculaceae bacterium]|nr:MBL fold metallo-hydrolase [Roseburia sp.]MCM1432111.1 MBL fold metallo-hydrolase [Muribaculaceae bacterium]MCM1493978.1 MBL fold metallo-hydrolase [Muribaculaceae bacterium]